MQIRKIRLIEIKERAAFLDLRKKRPGRMCWEHQGQDPASARALGTGGG